MQSCSTLLHDYCKIMTPQARELKDHRLVAFDWSTQTEQLAADREEWRCCTTGHGVQFVTTLGPIVMPELHAGIKNPYSLCVDHNSEATSYNNSGCLAFKV